MAARRPRRLRLPAWVPQIVLALCAAAWAATILPTAALVYGVDRAAKAAVTAVAATKGGDAQLDMRLATLQRRLTGARRTCPGPLVADRLLLAAARMELALRDDDLAAQDARAIDFAAAARAAVGCAPGEGLAWLDLYWLRLRDEGLSARALAYLRASHRFAPHEAGVALVRNPLEMPVLDRLPSDLRAAALTDLSDLVDAQLPEPAADTIGRLRPERRNALIAGIERAAGADAYDAFAAALRRRDMMPARDDRERFHAPFVQGAP